MATSIRCRSRYIIGRAARLGETAHTVVGVMPEGFRFPVDHGFWAGVYAMLSFTVARRRREIGIRLALGADRRRILGSIFARAGAQFGGGIAVGLMLALALQWAAEGDAIGSGTEVGAGMREAFLLMPVVAGIVIAVGLLAALGPARRGLAVQPTEALREE